MHESKTYTPGGKSSYAHRKARRLNNGPMSARETMPYFFEMITKDFAQREREAVAVRAKGGQLSSDPQRPWGEKKVPRPVAAVEVEVAEELELDQGPGEIPKFGSLA